MGSTATDPDCKLIALCARADPGEDRLAKIATLIPEIRWERALAVAAENRMAPLLYWNLRRLPSSAVPESVMTGLFGKYRKNLIDNLAVLGDVEALARAFGEAVPFILLKGVVLAFTAYPDPGLRPFSDIDVLIHKSQLGEAAEKLTKLGYRRYSQLRPDLAASFENEVDYLKSQPFPLHLDVHWQLFKPYYGRHIESGRFWNKAVRVTIEDRPYLALSPEHLLLHLCLHTVETPVPKTIALADLALAAGDEALDWEEFLDEVIELRVGLLVARALDPVRPHNELPVPEFVLQELRSYRATAQERQLMAFVGDEGIGAKVALGGLWTTPGWMAKLRFLAAKLFPERAFLIRRYRVRNDRLVPFYFVRWWVSSLRCGITGFARILWIKMAAGQGR